MPLGTFTNENIFILIVINQIKKMSGYKARNIFVIIGHVLLISIIFCSNKNILSLPIDPSSAIAIQLNNLSNHIVGPKNLQSDSISRDSRGPSRNQNEQSQQLDSVLQKIPVVAPNKSNRERRVKNPSSQETSRVLPIPSDGSISSSLDSQASNYASTNVRLNQSNNRFVSSDADKLFEGSGAGPPHEGKSQKQKYDDTEDSDDDDDDEDYDDKESLDSGSGNRPDILTGQNMNVNNLPMKTPSDKDIYNPFRSPVTPSKSQASPTNDYSKPPIYIRPAIMPSTASLAPVSKAKPALTRPSASITTMAPATTSTSINILAQPSSPPLSKIDNNETKHDSDYDYEEDSEDDDAEEASAFEDNDPSEFDAHIYNKTSPVTPPSPISVNKQASKPLSPDHLPSNFDRHGNRSTDQFDRNRDQSSTNLTHTTIDKTQHDKSTTPKPNLVHPSSSYEGLDEMDYRAEEEDEEEEEEEEDEDALEEDIDNDRAIKVPTGGGIQNFNQPNTAIYSNFRPSNSTSSPSSDITVPKNPNLHTLQYDLGGSTTITSQNDRFTQNTQSHDVPLPTTQIASNIYSTTPVPSILRPSIKTNAPKLIESSTMLPRSSTVPTLINTIPSTTTAQTPYFNNQQPHLTTPLAGNPAYSSVFPPPTTMVPNNQFKYVTTQRAKFTPVVTTATNLLPYDREVRIMNDDGLTRQIYDRVVEVLQEIEKTLRQAWEAVWPPNMNFDSACFEPILAQPMFFMCK